MRLGARHFVLLAVAAVAWFPQAPHAHAQVFAHLPTLTLSAAALPAYVALENPESIGAAGSARFDLLLPQAEHGAVAPASPANDRALFRTLSAPERVFGGVEIRIGNTAHSAKWLGILNERADRYFVGECDGPRQVCDAPSRAVIANAIEQASSVGPREAIQLVNAAVNRSLRFTDDLAQYGVNDHWATASESLRSGRGDCEDYAILKYWALAALGVPVEAMRLVIVRDVRRRLDHAVLAIAANGENLILDSLTNEVRFDSSIRNYEPRISFGAEGAWLHGRLRPQVASADMGALASAR